jgi:hypothetical protein
MTRGTRKIQKLRGNILYARLEALLDVKGKGKGGTMVNANKSIEGEIK